ELELLFKLESATSRAQSLDELVSAALSTTAQACGARGAGLTFAQSEGAEIVHFFFDSQRQPALERMVTRARDGLLGSVMQKGEQLLYGVADLVDSMSTLQTEQGKL